MALGGHFSNVKYLHGLKKCLGWKKERKKKTESGREKIGQIKIGRNDQWARS